MKSSQQDCCPLGLEERVELVKWELTDRTSKYNLVTVHSLIIDDNPKFIELKSLVHQYNQTVHSKLDRPHLRQAFIAKLYRLLCQMIRIPLMENQLSFLDKVYQWAGSNITVLQNGGQLFQPENLDGNRPPSGKHRPTTASTRTRPFSAHSRPFSGISRGYPIKNVMLVDPTQHIAEMNKEFENVDYEKLQLGEREFYDGTRTIHREYQHPRKRLKEYRRKVYYDELDKDNSDEELKEEEQILKQLPVYDMKKFQQKAEQQPPIQEPLQGEEGKEGQDGADMLGQEDINVDDIPLEGEQEQPEEQQEKVDKLKPHVKVYHDYHDVHQKKGFQSGVNRVNHQQAYKGRKFDQDTQIATLMTQWANNKAARHRQYNRRSESARMVTQKLGVNVKQQKAPPLSKDFNVIDLTENLKSFQVKTNLARPRTAFHPKTNHLLNQAIKDAFTTGNLGAHVQVPKESISEKHRAMSAVAPKTKRKTFDEILRQAEQRVQRESELQIESVKQALAKNKVNINIGRIAKSITSYEPQLPGGERFVGQITGTNMMKNPFFKVAKKKKKKKKK